MHKAVVGITGNILTVEDGKALGFYRSYVNHDYIESVAGVGGIPLILPMIDNPESIEHTLSLVDGIIISGGYDIDPQLYGEDPLPAQEFTCTEVDAFYMRVITLAHAMHKPILGICKGMQAINVAFGGTLYQDLPSQKSGIVQHRQAAPRHNGTHRIHVQPHSELSRYLPASLLVNSYHHQAVKDLAKGFTSTATSEDGVIEAMEKHGESPLLGVQWHPEMMAAHGDALMLALFQNFIRTCSSTRP